MKKFAKMSLVAALAVAGTTASAADLAEAIKGVDISGVISYEYQDSKDQRTGGSSTQTNEYDAELTVKSPVNDMVTAVLKFDVAADTTGDADDANGAVNLEDVYFSINTGYATINAGKMNVPTNFTDGAQGTGVVALVPAGPVTVAAGYFNNHSIDAGAVTTTKYYDINSTGDTNSTLLTTTSAVSSTINTANTYDVGDVVASQTTVDALHGTNLAAVGILGSAGPVNFEAWYADVSNTLDAYEVKASAKVMDLVNVTVRHSSEQADAAGSKKNDLTAIELSGAAGPVNLSAAYATTSSDNSGVGIDNDQDAKVGFELSQASIHNKADADAWKVGANMDVMANLNLGIDYLDYDYKTAAKVKSDGDELKVTAKYTMSKNFVITTYFSQYEDQSGATKNADNDKGAIELKYSF